MSLPLVTLESWSVMAGTLIPGVKVVCLAGYAFKHPKVSDGTYIHTSAIVSTEKRLVVTCDAIYKLGIIDPKYRRWLRGVRPEWNHRKPIAVTNGLWLS